MKIVTFTEARNNFKSVLDSAIDDADVTIIHRRDGEDAVLMGRGMYESMKETMYLLSNPANAQHLAESIEQYKSGNKQERQLLDAE